MLVLTRKVGESIRIGEDIEIFVSAIDRNKVKIGVRSPGDVPVHRSEVYDRVRRENREAVLVAQEDLEEIVTHMPSSPRGDADRLLRGSTRKKQQQR